MIIPPGLQRHHRRKFALCGQAAVDYSGALVVACVIIGSILALSPFSLNTFFNNLLAGITNTMSQKAEDIEF
jgi:hypothetical protein